MDERRYPNESPAYRKARTALLKDEQELIAKTKAVAAKRRKLPLGGKLKEDYVFERASGAKVGQRVKFSKLFGEHDTLLLYSFMFGPQLGQAVPLVHLAHGRLRPHRLPGVAQRRVRRHRQGAA